MSHITTHVLDTAVGRPAAGLDVALQAESSGEPAGPRWVEVATGTTDADGRITDLGPDTLFEGTYRLAFATLDYFDAQGVDAFYPEITVAFRVTSADQHYHVPVLLSPFAYSTYRGS